MKIKIIICVLLLVTLCAASVAEDATQGNAAMILFNVTPSAFDDCHVFVSPLDQYGRAGTAFAILSRASIDSERRQDISMFQPVGFQHNRQYAGIDGNSIYHRCHLVGAQLTAGTACLENLVTGTQYLNIKGLLLIANDTEAPGTRQGQPDYVLNVKSQRFHYPWCSGVETMSAKNRQDYYGDRQALIDQGYKPCGTCNP